MALRFNTFRSQRYLRSKFVEGKFLLASEGTDLQLEILDLFRQQTKALFGEAVAVEEAWKVERLNNNQLLIKPGEAWIQGLPFSMRGGKDQLVSGSTLVIGTVPVGVNVADDATGLGKVLTFELGTTPSNLYRVVVTAREELITDIQDPFLKNVNLTESTQQKLRIVFQLNIVPENTQDESPIPYRNEASVGVDPSLTPTNFPGTGNDAQPNFVNKIKIEPTLGVGQLLSIINLTGTEAIDGKNLELIIANPLNNNPIPQSPGTQAAFSNGRLIDSNGTEFHINFITNDAVGGQVKIVIDKEFQQPDPVIDAPGGRPYFIIKRDVYATDDVNGIPQGTAHWPVATVEWDDTDGFVHESSITDLRKHIVSQSELQSTLPNKLDLFMVGGGQISWDAGLHTVDWTNDVKLVNPYTPIQTVPAGSEKILDGGAIVYKMDLVNGGVITQGTLAISSTSSGTTISLTGAPNLSSVTVGNLVADDNGDVAAVVSVDNINKVLVVDSALSFTAGGEIHLDSYAPNTVKKSLTNFVFAVREGSKIYLGLDGLELENGETSQIGDGVSVQLLTYIGTPSESQPSPDYTSNAYVADGDSLTTAIGKLDAALDTLETSVSNIQWKAPVADEASLPLLGNVDGDVRLVLDNRVAYTWVDADSEWLPISGAGGGIVKVKFYDPFSTALPTGTSITIDGVAGQNGDTVLFSNLTSGNNRVYELSGVGVSLVWTPLKLFNNDFSPVQGDSVRITHGDIYGFQLAVFNGTTFDINDFVRYFDTTSGNFWEQSSLKTKTLNNDQTDVLDDEIFTVGYVGSENIIMDYSIIRGSTKAVGTLHIVTDGTDVSISDTSAFILDTGVDFEAYIDGTDLVLSYLSTDTGDTALLKYSVKRWSDQAGGPSGIPDYSVDIPNSNTPAAGAIGDVQFHGSLGNLAADVKFKWSTADSSINLNGLRIAALSDNFILSNNQTSPTTIFSYSATTYKHAIIEYSAERNGEYRTGRLLVSNGTSGTPGFSDDFVDTAALGITLSAEVSGGDVLIRYTTTNTGFSANFKYSIRRW
jgi:hypothetical protein